MFTMVLRDPYERVIGEPHCPIPLLPLSQVTAASGEQGLAFPDAQD